MHVTSGDIVLSGLALLIAGIGGIPLVAGLYWYRQYLRILFYVCRYHKGDLLAIGISTAAMLCTHILFNTGLIVCILTILAWPTLTRDTVLLFFVFPIPVYILAQRSIWNYQMRFWCTSDVNFGDAKLINMRSVLSSRHTRFLKLLIAEAAIFVSLILFGVILRYVQMVVQHQ